MSVEPGSDERLAGAADADLGEAAAAGVKWGFVANLGEHLARTVFTFWVARLIGPSEFGVMSQATIIVLLTWLLLEQGLGGALIQKRRLDDRDVGTVLAVTVGVSLLLAALTFATAGWVATFFRTPELAPVLRVLALTLVLKGLAVAPLAVLNRALRFRPLALIELVSVVVGGAIGLAAAFRGAGYWALVIQAVLIDGCRLAGLLLVGGRPPLAVSAASLREMWRFSAGLMGSQLLLYVERNLDNILIGRYLGPRPLALYGLGYRLMTLPLMTLGQVVNRVAFPVFSRIQDEPVRTRGWLVGATATMAMVSWPVFVLVILAAPDAVPLVLGPAWEPAVVPLQVLALVGCRQSVVKLVGPVFMGTGRSGLLFAWQLVTVVLLAPAFAVGLEWDIIGVAVAYAAVNFVLAPFVVGSAGRLVGLRVGEYGRALVPALWASLGLAAGWTVSRLGLAALDAGRPVVLVVCGLAAAAAWLLTARLTRPDALDELVRVFRRVAASRAA